MRPIQNSQDRRNPSRSTGADRRRFPRFVLPAGYAPLKIRRLDRDIFDLDGFAYDISEGGIRFELDQPIEPGSRVAMQIMLPGLAETAIGPGRAVFVFANVVWIEDEDEPGPVKMAAVFSNFARAIDSERLRNQLTPGRLRAAA